MILFHGSNVAIEVVDFNESKPGKDFGGRGTGTCPKPKNQEFTKYTLNCSLMAA